MSTRWQSSVTFCQTFGIHFHFHFRLVISCLKVKFMHMKTQPCNTVSNLLLTSLDSAGYVFPSGDLFTYLLSYIKKYDQNQYTDNFLSRELINFYNSKGCQIFIKRQRFIYDQTQYIDNFLSREMTNWMINTQLVTNLYYPAA